PEARGIHLVLQNARRSLCGKNALGSVTPLLARSVTQLRDCSGPVSREPRVPRQPPRHPPRRPPRDPPHYGGVLCGVVDGAAGGGGDPQVGRAVEVPDALALPKWESARRRSCPHSPNDEAVEAGEWGQERLTWQPTSGGPGHPPSLPRGGQIGDRGGG